MDYLNPDEISNFTEICAQIIIKYKNIVDGESLVEKIFENLNKIFTNLGN